MRGLLLQMFLTKTNKEISSNNCFFFLNPDITWMSKPAEVVFRRLLPYLQSVSETAGGRKTASCRWAANMREWISRAPRGRSPRQGRRARWSLAQGTTCSTCSCTCWLYNTPWSASRPGSPGRTGTRQGSSPGALQKPRRLASGFHVNKKAHFGCRVRPVKSPKWAETYPRLL